MRIPKYQLGTPDGGVRDNTRVVNPHLQVLPLAQFPKLLPFYGDPRLPQLRAETRTPRELLINNQEGKKKAETQQWLEQRARNAEAANKLMSLTMPSTYVGQIIGLQLTGLPALAVDLAVAPVAGAMRTVGRKGALLAIRNLPKVSLGRNASGKWNGWINVGNYQYRPSRNTLAMNFPGVERRPITNLQTTEKDIHNTLMNVAMKATKLSLQGKLGKTQVDELASRLYAYLSLDQAKQFIKRAEFFLKGDKTALAIELKALKNVKGKKGLNVAINKVIKEERTPAQIVRDLLNKYIPKLEEVNNRTRLLTRELYGKQSGKDNFIDWLHDESPGVDFLGSGIYDPRYGKVVNDTPFLQRYYENVMEITKPGGLLEKLIKEGKLKLNEDGQWIGLNELGEYGLVDAKLYIISQLENFKASGNRYTSMYQRPVHGTKLNSGQISKLFANPSKKYLFTVDAKNLLNGEILNAENIMLDVYAGNNGSKIPFYYKAERYEGDPLRAYPKKGESSESNHFGKYGELKSYFDGTDKAHSVEQVVDPTNHGGAINEYDFGKGTPNIKSMWNTLDFEIGGSPFAYIPTKKINITSNSYA